MTKKTIVFDLRPLQIGHQNRGIGMVIRSTLENLDDKVNHYVFYMFEGSNPIKDLKININDIDYEIVYTPLLRTHVKSPSDLVDVAKVMFHRFMPLKHLKIDVFVQFDFSLGLVRSIRTKNILLAYDLIPLIMKREYLPSPMFAASHTPGKKQKIKVIFRSIYYLVKSKINYRTYRRANHVIAISDTVKKSFVEMLNLKPNKITVIPLAPVASESGYDDSILKKHGINSSYILYIGGTDTRKRIEEIVYAFNITRGRGSEIDLVLAGSEFVSLKKLPNQLAKKAITNSPYRDNIHFVGYIDDKSKNSLYKHAHAFVFCSIYEGFGLPVLESFAQSAPVIAYDNSSIHEIGSGAALLVETNNYMEVAAAIGSLFDESRRNELVKSGHEKAKDYSWKKYSEEFAKIVFD